jgi:putative transposase
VFNSQKLDFLAMRNFKSQFYFCQKKGTMEKFQNKYRIPSARAVWYDYNEGVYFITICTARRKHYFGEIVQHRMQLNQLGEELFKIINKTETHNEYAEIQLFQIMPNHVHLIVSIDGKTGYKNRTDSVTDNDTDTVMETDGIPDKNGISENKMREMAKKRGKLSTTIGSIKSALTCFANTNHIPFGWQDRFHDHIIRDENEYNRIWIYIVNNPANWTGDKFFK